MESTRGSFIHSLAFKIGVAIILTEIVISAVTGAFYINNFNAQVDRLIEHNVLQPAALINGGLLSLDVVTDDEAMREIVGEEVTNAFIIGVNGNIFYSLNEDYAGLPASSVPQINSNLLTLSRSGSLVRQDTEQDIIISVSPLYGPDGKTIRFYLYLEASTTAATAQKRNNALLFVMGSLAIVMLTSIVILIAFNRTIFNPLQHFLSALKRVEAGDLTTQLASEKDDELADVAMAFNHMTIQLRQGLENLRQERDLVARIMETSPVGITTVNRDGQVTFANPQAENILGLTKDKITQRTYNAPEWRITDYQGNPFPNEELPFKRVISIHQPVYDVQHAIVWPDGRRLFLSINGAPNLDESGEVNSVVFTLQDITERKRAENALKTSEERYRRIIDTANEGIWVLGPDAITTFANARMSHMLGYSDEEMIGRLLTDFMFKEDVPDHLKKMENRRKGISENYERRFRRKNGQTIWTLASATPIFEDGHNFKGSFAMFTDITERKMAEDHKREFYRLTILAATEGKLQLAEREEIERIAGLAEAVFPVTNADDFRNIRTAVVDIARSQGMDELRAGDYVVAVGEAVTNATKHAGSGIVAISVLPEAILTVISDKGLGIEAMSIPRVALEKGYTTAGTLGMGYKVMLSIADKVYLATGPWGTTVGIEMYVKPPEISSDLSAIYRI